MTPNLKKQRTLTSFFTTSVPQSIKEPLPQIQQETKAEHVKEPVKSQPTPTLLNKENTPEQVSSSISYSLLTDTFDLIASTTKRLEISQHLTNCFLKVISLNPSSLLACVYLCLNRIGPEYEAKELGIGESLIIKAIAQSTGRELKNIKADFVEKGDLGQVALVCLLRGFNDV